MRYDIKALSSAKSKEIARKADQYLTLMPSVEKVALSTKDHRTLIESAQKLVNAKAKKSQAKPPNVDSIFILKNSRDVYFMAVDV